MIIETQHDTRHYYWFLVFLGPNWDENCFKIDIYFCARCLCALWLPWGCNGRAKKNPLEKLILFLKQSVQCQCGMKYCKTVCRFTLKKVSAAAYKILLCDQSLSTGKILVRRVPNYAAYVAWQCPNTDSNEWCESLPNNQIHH